jgi:hypothetical protein
VEFGGLNDVFYFDCFLWSRIRQLSFCADLRGQERNAAQRPLGFGAIGRRPLAEGYQIGSVTRITRYEDDPRYEIKSSKTDHIAVHKGSALRKQHD